MIGRGHYRFSAGVRDCLIDSPVVGCNYYTLNKRCLSGLLERAKDQWLAAQIKQKLARQTRRRIPGRYDHNNFLFGILAVMLHGILEYSQVGRLARFIFEYLEVRTAFAKLTYVLEQPENSYNLTPLPVDPPAVPAVEPTPDNPPWGSAVAIGAWILSVVLIAIVPALALAPYAFTRSGEFADNADLIKFLSTDPTAIALQILAIIPAHLLTLVLAWLIVTSGRRYSFKKMLGWRAGGMQWWHYVVIMAAFFVLAAGIGSLVPEQDNEMLRILRSSRYVVLLVAFMAVVTAPIVEEVVYRGLLYSALQRAVGTGLAVGFVTFLFSLVHLPQYYPSISTMILLTLLSLTLTLIRVYTGNLLPCIILHTIFNGVQSILLIAEPYIKIDSTTDDAITALFFYLK